MILGEEPLDPRVAEQLAAHAQRIALAGKAGSAGQVEPAAQNGAAASSAKVDVRDPLARLKALAGETMVLPQTEREAKQDLRARALEPAHAGEPAIPRALAGGTQVMPVANVPLPGRRGVAEYHEQAEEGGEPRQGDEDDSEDHRATEQVVSSRRGSGARPGWSPAQSQLASRGATAMGGALLQAGARLWREKPRLILVVAGAVVLLGLVLAATVPMSGRASSTSKARPPAAGSPTGSPAHPPPARAPEAPKAGTLALPGTPKLPPETVRIDVHGIPPGTEVTLDGAPSALPVVVLRGKDSHRIGVRTPDGTQQSVDVDSTRDRVVELVLPLSQPPAVKENARAREPGGRDSSSWGKELPRRNGDALQKKLPRARPKDLDAITDI